MDLLWGTERRTINTYTIMKNKLCYTTPEVERVTVKCKESILTGSGTVENITKKDGEWDE